MNRFIFACVCLISTHSFAAPYDANLDYQSKERVGQRAKYLVEACIQVEKDKIDEAKSRAALLKYCATYQDSYVAEKQALAIEKDENQLRKDWSNNTMGWYCVSIGFKP